ncbi:hypothetical protein [Novosphingobium sp.]|uniref:hypothetical protein n=1 Tax=Novosphingobium sp. TaxID=1874826 RepID=UPI0035AF18EE
MNHKLLTALIVAGLALPGVAQAKVTNNDLRHDAARVHKEKRELAHARKHHRHHQARHERHELRQAKRDLHRDAHAYARQHSR